MYNMQFMLGGDGPLKALLSRKVKWSKSMHMIFVKKGYFRLLTLFWKYYPLDKHFKHGFKIFRPIFNNLLYSMDGYG